MPRRSDRTPIVGLESLSAFGYMSRYVDERALAAPEHRTHVWLAALFCSCGDCVSRRRPYTVYKEARATSFSALLSLSCARATRAPLRRVASLPHLVSAASTPHPLVSSSSRRALCLFSFRSLSLSRLCLVPVRPTRVAYDLFYGNEARVRRGRALHNAPALSTSRSRLYNCGEVHSESESRASVIKALL